MEVTYLTVKKKFSIVFEKKHSLAISIEVFTLIFVATNINITILYFKQVLKSY